MNEGRSGVPRRAVAHRLAVAGLLVTSAALAVTSLVGDSVTFDETSHLPAGLSYLKTGDFRLAPDHPPLAKIWCAWPLLFMNLQWPLADDPTWQGPYVFSFGQRFLFELGNDGQRVVVIGRCMMVVLLLATALTVYALGRMAFGPAAGLLALTLAALSPTLLAHGRLITTDVPITLATGLVLLTFARLMQRMTWSRLLAAAAALGAAAATKFSWPLVLPALASMGVMAVLRSPNEEPGTTPRAARLQRAARIGASSVVLAAVAWIAIWAVYWFRPTMLASPSATEQTPELQLARQQLQERLAATWTERVYDAYDGTPRRGLVPAFLRLTAAAGLLPEAYLYGLAETLETTARRTAFLMGEYSETGWRTYFPIAFAIKTPLPTLGLLVAGVVALARRRGHPADPVLLVGLVTFAVVYAAYMINSPLNIGHRHLLPIYPVFFVVAGAAVVWLKSRPGRLLLAAGVTWLAGANLWIHPHYLAYFNELIGGPARGHLYLTDSNIDWGQDLLRLADYARHHPGEPIRLSYFGSALPTWYLDCTTLPSFLVLDPPAELTAGTFVVSATMLQGLYPAMRTEFWTAQSTAAYRTLWEIAAAPPGADESPERQEQRARARVEYESLRAARLVSELRARPPDARIGYSLFVFRLTDEEIERLAGPRLP